MGYVAVRNIVHVSIHVPEAYKGTLHAWVATQMAGYVDRLLADDAMVYRLEGPNGEPLVKVNVTTF